MAYVNTTADVKALTDVCCTSANAVDVVRSLGDAEILFVPDKNLADYSKRQTNAAITPWDGYCYVHNFLSVKDVERVKAEHPGAVLLIHPEAPPEVVALADEVLSTSGMAKYVAEIADAGAKKNGVIIGTEIGPCSAVDQKPSRCQHMAPQRFCRVRHNEDDYPCESLLVYRDGTI